MSWNNNLSDYNEGNFTTIYSSSGGFNANYDFEDQALGTSGTSINFVDWASIGAGTSITLTDDDSIYHNRLDVYDSHASNLAYMYNSFSAQTSGTIEWWWKVSSTGLNYVYISSSGGTNIDLYAMNGYFKYYSGGGWNVAQAYTINTWYHHRIDFDCGTDKFTWYIDSVNRANDKAFEAVATTLNRFYVKTGSGADNIHAYIDNPGYSWETDYSVGDNIEPIPAMLNFTIPTHYIGEIGYQLNYAFNTSTSELVNFSVYNNDLGNWESINSTYFNHSLFYENSSSHFSDYEKYINATNDILYKIEISDYTNNFTFSLDYFKCDSRSYVNVSVNKLFNVKGNWRYRFALESYSELYYTSWTLFEVVGQVVTPAPNDNIEIVSEAPYSTKWVFTNATDTITEFLNPYGLKTFYLYPDTYTYNITDLNDNLNQTGTITSNGSLQTIIYNYSEGISPFDNIEIISEAPYSTKWVFSNATDAIIKYLNPYGLKTLYLYPDTYSYNITDTNNNFNQTGSISSNGSLQTIIYSYSEGPLVDNIEIISEAPYTTKWEFTNATETITKYLNSYGLKTFYLYPDTYTYNITDLNDNYNLTGSIMSNTSLQTIIYNYSESSTPDDNIEIISESDRITRWLFVNETYSDLVFYNETFDDTGQGYWDLFGVDNRAIVIDGSPSDDAYVYDNNPNSNYGSEIDLYAYYYDMAYPTPDMTRNSYIKLELPYLFNNYTDNSTFRCYAWQPASSVLFNVYHTSDFDESTITWNNKPSSFDVQNTITTITPDTWNVINIGSPNNYYSFITDESVNRMARISSKDHPNIPATIKHYLTKNGHIEGILYCQTNIDEDLTLRSPNNLSLNLEIGDYIEITLNTTSENQINFNLKKDGNIVKSYIVHTQGLADTNTRTLTFSLNEDINGIDQLEFTGFFESGKNLIIENVLIHRVESEHQEVLDPDGYKQFRLAQPRNYTVYIFDNNYLKEMKSITTGTGLLTLTYTRIDDKEIYLTYYDSNFDFLNFYEYITYINYTLNNESYYDKRLGTNNFYADENSVLQVKIYDSFDSVIKTYETYAQNFIDIILDVYSLKIKSECLDIVNYSLNLLDGSIVKTGNIFPSEIIEFSIASGNYSFNFTNHEDNNIYRLNINLINHRTTILNSTFHTIYFALFTVDGLGLDPNLVRFYINASRKDFGFNTIGGDYANLTILDYFNATLKTEIITLEGLLEWNIFCEVYSLHLYNNYTWHGIKINVSRSDSPYTFTQTIPTYSSITLRFIPNILYNISYYYMNDTLIGLRQVNLTSNGHIESFGVYETYPETSFFPANCYISLSNALGHGFHALYFKIYKNGVRIEPGLNVIESNSTFIEVYDYFDNLLHSNYYFYATEINIVIDTIEEVIFMSNMTEALIIRIKMFGEDIWYNDTLGANKQPKILYLTQQNYTIKAEYLNGTLFNEFNVSIDDSKIIDIGWYKPEVPAIPTQDILRGIENTWFWLIVAIIGIGLIVSIIGIYWKRIEELRLKRQREKESARMKKMLKIQSASLYLQ